VRRRFRSNLPIGAETELEGHVDLITMKEWVWAAKTSAPPGKCAEIRDSLKDRPKNGAQAHRAAVEMDDDAMEAYLEGERAGHRHAAQADPQGHAVAFLRAGAGGSAFKNKGVQPMLNAVIDFLPGPLDVPPYMGFCRATRRNP
jgi:elongation factor G